MLARTRAAMVERHPALDELIASWQGAPGLETWRVPRTMVIIEPEGQERSNPEEPRLRWAAQRSSVMGKIITVISFVARMIPLHRSHQRMTPVRNNRRSAQNPYTNPGPNLVQGSTVLTYALRVASAKSTSVAVPRRVRRQAVCSFFCELHCGNCSFTPDPYRPICE